MSLLFQENSVRTPFRAEFLGGKNLWVVKLCRIRHRNSSCFCLLRDGGRSFSLFQAQEYWETSQRSQNQLIKESQVNKNQNKAKKASSAAAEERFKEQCFGQLKDCGPHQNCAAVGGQVRPQSLLCGPQD
uniref:Uncharacterized protein LOC104245335 isoform X1 n=1 Tax=Nicotiana sylvestris TaxID=4096 RepID=A0A1U7YK73_NICSY|nr:PREDICTED: uncharacterized protein LOC104245335 isoform X1 [Nicotiana sylvestris]